MLQMFPVFLKGCVGLMSLPRGGDFMSLPKGGDFMSLPKGVVIEMVVMQDKILV